MDWTALLLSLELAACTAAILAPIGIVLGRALAWRRFRGKVVVEALLALPLVLPPTVLGYYLLVSMGASSPVSRVSEWLAGRPLVFTFSGLVVASIVVNLPFAIQPMQRAFEAVSRDVRDAAACCGMSRWRIFSQVELPLAWPGIASALVLTFAHTIGEFGVVLMVGGNIPGQTRTISVAIYDRVQAFDDRGAGIMAATLLALSLCAMVAVYATTGRRTVGR
jgi:molybdate transport system permease protein